MYYGGATSHCDVTLNGASTINNLYQTSIDQLYSLLEFLGTPALIVLTNIEDCD